MYSLNNLQINTYGRNVNIKKSNILVGVLVGFGIRLITPEIPACINQIEIIIVIVVQIESIISL